MSGTRVTLRRGNIGRKLDATGRGSALFTALLVVAAGAVIGMGVLAAGSRAAMTATRATARLDQRTLAWSAVQAVMADLGSQREGLLAGGAPALKGEYTLWQEGSRTATAKLMPFSSASVRDDAPPVAQPEGGKVDLNLADRETLLRLAVMDESVVDAIIARRSQRPWSSVEELASLAGIGASELFGGGKSDGTEAPKTIRTVPPATVTTPAPPSPTTSPTPSPTTPPTTSPSVAPNAGKSPGKSNEKGGRQPGGKVSNKPSDKAGEKGNTKGGDAGAVQDSVPVTISPMPLTSVLTVHSFDPSVATSGEARSEGSKPEAGDGARLNVRETSATLAAEIDARCGTGASVLLKAMKDVPGDTPSGTALVMAMRQAAVPVALWPAVLDELSTTSDPFVQGLVDVNTADARVLVTVPGIDQAAATAIVEGRMALAAAKRSSVTWILTEGILDQDRFQLAVGRLTTRSMQWRLRIEAGLAGESGGAGSETVLSNRVVIDVVIDVADARPRLAYMRDVTLLPAAMVLNERFKGVARKAAEDAPPPDPTPPTPPEPPPPTLVDSGPTPAPPPDPMPQSPVNQTDNRDAPAEPKGPTIHDPRTGRWTPGRKAE